MWFWAIFIVIAVWWLFKRSKSTEVVKQATPAFVEKGISEEEVFKAQSSFEKKILETYLPDHIHRKDIYIYQNLMSKWFSKLSGQNRYDENKIQKLRKDFLDYMEACEQGSSANYLSFEVENEQERDSYSEEAEMCARKSFAIENAFAEALGQDAVSELNRIRSLNLTSISRSGELAPEGMEFDANDRLKPKK